MLTKVSEPTFGIFELAEAVTAPVCRLAVRPASLEVGATVENVYRRARARYGDKAGEMIPAKMYEDDTNTPLRFK